MQQFDHCNTYNDWYRVWWHYLPVCVFVRVWWPYLPVHVCQRLVTLSTYVCVCIGLVTLSSSVCVCQGLVTLSTCVCVCVCVCQGLVTLSTCVCVCLSGSGDTIYLCVFVRVWWHYLPVCVCQGLLTLSTCVCLSGSGDTGDRWSLRAGSWHRWEVCARRSKGRDLWPAELSWSGLGKSARRERCILTHRCKCDPQLKCTITFTCFYSFLDLT